MRTMTIRCVAAALFAAVLVGGGCAMGEGSDGVAGAAEVGPAPVDSIFPIEEEIRRFRAMLGPEPAALVGGAPSRDELVSRFVGALERADTAVLLGMALSPEEFGYLYYPHTHYTSRPYELSPALVWFQLQNHGGRGMQRALRRYGGRSLAVTGYHCEEEPLVQGPNRIWRDCLVIQQPPYGEERMLSLFGAILERDGHFKFVSFANRLSS